MKFISYVLVSKFIDKTKKHKNNLQMKTIYRIFCLIFQYQTNMQVICF